jgi:Asp-tRNA(Asn)/Glu-tRNA(Gln) amidotransferase A subunit family amidase
MRRDLRSLKIGYVENSTPAKEREELRVLRDLGVQLTAIKLPNKYPLQALQVILTAEAATAFDDLTRTGMPDGPDQWATSFRRGQFITAIDYLRANRVRTLVMREMAEVMSEVDAYVGGNDLVLTNFTGHPTVVLPNGFQKRNDIETPTAITFTGRLFGETELLALAHAYQQATEFHLKHPPMDKLTPEKASGE